MRNSRLIRLHKFSDSRNESARRRRKSELSNDELPFTDANSPVEISGNWYLPIAANAPPIEYEACPGASVSRVVFNSRKVVPSIYSITKKGPVSEHAVSAYKTSGTGTVGRTRP